MITRPKLTYFDFSGSRGEECRLALHLAGVAFDDNRIKGSDWPALQDSTPFGSLPVLELPGRPPLAQSNAILCLIGRGHGLHPADNFEAARHEAVMAHVEDLRHKVSPTIRMPDDEKRRVREELAASWLPKWAARAEQAINGDGPFFGGAEVNVVDLKLYMAVRWFAGGAVDHVPANIFAPYARLMRVHDAVAAHPGVRAWYART